MKLLFILGICSLDQLEKDVPRKSILNKSGIFLKISLPSFSSTVPTTENVYTKHFYQHMSTKQKHIIFSLSFHKFQFKVSAL